MFIERRISPELKAHLQAKQMTVITGMRRTGKTTLVKRLLEVSGNENRTYIDLERLDNRELFYEKNYDNIAKALSDRGLDLSKNALVGIDEIQKAPQAISALKYLYDNYNIKFIVTGSSSYYLKSLFGESLSGRKKLFELWPLDFGEFLAFKGVLSKKQEFAFSNFSKPEFERLKSFYDEYVLYGGFPEVVLAKSPAEKKDLLSDLTSSYVNIDMASIADLKDVRNVYNLMKILAGRIGTRLDYAKISRVCGLSRQIVVNYMDLFEKTYLITRVPVLSKHPDREIVKAQKLYFCDNGMARELFDIGGGAAFENAIFNQLRSKGSLRYYSLKSGREIDFILDAALALEAKESPTKSDLNSLAKLSKMAGVREFRLIGKNIVPGFDDYIWGGNIR